MKTLLASISRRRLTYSSRLLESAYAAGFAGHAGHRGDELFELWLEGERIPDAHSGFLRRLKEEYFRGVEAHEQERAKPAAAAEPAEPTAAAVAHAFQGYRIEPAAEGEYAVPSLDPESRFESVKEAQRFIAVWGRPNKSFKIIK